MRRPLHSQVNFSTAPRSMERSAKSAEGTIAASSRRRLVGAQRITIEIWRPLKFC